MKKEQIISVVLILLTIVGLYYIKNSTTDETIVEEDAQITEKNKIQETEKQDERVLNELYVSEFNLEEILSKEVPVYIHFGANGCPPCEEMKPYVEKLHKKYGSEMFIMYVDIEKYGLMKFPVELIPTQFFFTKDGFPLSDEKILNEIKNFKMHKDENGMHELTAHNGLLTEEELIEIFKVLGLEIE